MSVKDLIDFRGIGFVVIEVINSNPNGDPNGDGDPRQRPDGIGEMSCQSIKRKMRDLIDYKDGPVWLHLKKRFNLNDEHYQIIESRDKKIADIRKNISSGNNCYWDGRLFGNTVIKKDKEGENIGKTSIRCGPVVVTPALSIAPVEIARNTITSLAGVEDDKNQGMGPLAWRYVRHGVYYFTFRVNPSQTKTSGCTSQDIEVLLALLPYIFDHTASTSRPEMIIKRAFYAVHKNALGSFREDELIEVLKPIKKENPHLPSTSWSDYEVSSTITKELKDKMLEFRNLLN